MRSAGNLEAETGWPTHSPLPLGCIPLLDPAFFPSLSLSLGPSGRGSGGKQVQRPQKGRRKRV